jgi:hypothetical protein
VGGQCAACSGSQTLCNGKCVDTKVDPQSCGQCGIVCTGGKLCAAGACTCAAGTTDCGGTCVNLGSDAQHCGNCTTVCPAAGTCAVGVCGYCNVPSSGAFEACVQLDNVAGNAASENLQGLWPLATGHVWKYHGSSRTRSNTSYKLQIKVEPAMVYEGQSVTPVDFVKNDVAGYWGPGLNQNLRWMVVDWSQSSVPFLWARGDQRYDRTSLLHVERLRYDSVADPGNWPPAPNPNPNPPYVLLPQSIVANPSNQVLVNYITTRHQYWSCQGDASCTLAPRFVGSWFVGITNARVLLPYSSGGWIDAKRVEYMEIGIAASDGLSAPYVNDQAAVCSGNSSGTPRFVGVREDWYFVNGVGPALIITREVGYPMDYECVYQVARESLTFNNCDANAFLMRFDKTGYDPSWGF